jgi:hopanoid biosynthesis associated protein HpnK
VNEAVEQAHQNGILTAASLMVAGRASADAVARARRMPGLRVGLHVVLTDGTPTLPPDRIPDLVEHTGVLRKDMVGIGVDIFFRPSVRRQVRAEIEAQFSAYKATGLALDHVNSHHHFHLHPTVAAELVRAAQRHGMCGIRVPYEPHNTLHAIEPSVKLQRDLLTAPWAALLRTRVRRHGLLAPRRMFGLAWSGAMTQARMQALLAILPAGATEIYVHPATTNTFAGAAPGYLYAEELSALTAREVIEAARASGARLGGFRELV